MTHQIGVLSDQKCSCLRRCVRARIVVVKSDPSLAVGVPDFLEDNWRKNGLVPLSIDCSALFQWYDCDMSSFSEKTGDLTHLETPIQSTAIYFRAHTRKSTIHHLLRCHRRVSKHRDRIFEHFFRPIDTSLFLSD